MRQDWLLGSFITVGLCVHIGGSNCLIFTCDFSIGVDLFPFYFLLLIINIKGEHKKLGKILLFWEIYDLSLFILPAYNQHSISVCLALRSHVDVCTGHAFIILYTVCFAFSYYSTIIFLSDWIVFENVNWGDVSVITLLAVQAWGSEFRSLSPV